MNYRRFTFILLLTGLWVVLLWSGSVGTRFSAQGNPTMTPVPIVTANSQWTPVEQDFDGVTMVLVPPGCFRMGSDSGDSDEKPVHEVCFDQPIWMDKTEVTNGQFATFEGKAEYESKWTDAERPRERINWHEAALYCGAREARLPSEAEWEYAARGPDGLTFPWGNEFLADNVVYDGNSGLESANVGSRLGGVSWVGALDMSGNVWEWTNTLYQPYPYKTDDGRESTDDIKSVRVLRGGSIGNFVNNLRAADRGGNTPDHRNSSRGFRCARSYQ